VTDKATNGWEKVGFDAHDWDDASELGGLGMDPWKLPSDTIARQFAALREHDVRAVLMRADPLMVALGRPTREQVATTRASTAATLQALELTNGKTLDAVLRRGATNLVELNFSGKKLVRSIYLDALGRNPTPEELRLTEAVVGEKPTQQGVEDFLWAMSMLPEFQLIY
jgi:hypothetical protein